jgi:hypothetical protein
VILVNGRGVVTTPCAIAALEESNVKREMPEYDPGGTDPWHKIQLTTNSSPQGAKARSKGAESEFPVIRPLKEAILAAS